MTTKILIVDDDANILQSYKRRLRRQFNIEIALGGELGLEIIRAKGPFAVIVSDLRMPGMDGIKFLAQVRKCTPESVRILLTGQADLSDAIAVVNEGHIFRFLTKPCPPEIFAKALKDGIEQYRLLITEKELLDKTLKGSIKLVIDIVSMHSPEVFTRSIRVRNIANKIASRLNLEDLWQVDVAALLSQIGCVTIPGEILKKKCQGQSLSVRENEVFTKHPKVGKDLLANIPRLGEIAEAIAYQEKRFDGGGLPKDFKKGKGIPLIARILKAALDYDEMLTAGKSDKQAIKEMRRHWFWYDPDVLAALEAETLNAKEGFVVREVRAKDVETGMILADDIRTRTNLVLVPKRYEISETFRICILNFAEKGNVAEPIKILDRVETRQ
jgi:response regulator RpfG family c-di-GMP phosphodiesterase